MEILHQEENQYQVEDIVQMSLSQSAFYREIVQRESVLGSENQMYWL